MCCAYLHKEIVCRESLLHVAFPFIVLLRQELLINFVCRRKTCLEFSLGGSFLLPRNSGNQSSKCKSPLMGWCYGDMHFSKTGYVNPKSLTTIRRVSHFSFHSSFVYPWGNAPISFYHLLIIAIFSTATMRLLKKFKLLKLLKKKCHLAFMKRYWNDFSCASDVIITCISKPLRGCYAF